MDILNFISWIKGGRQVTSVDPARTLLPVGLKDGRRDDDYLTGAITVQDFINQVGTGTTGAQGPIGPQGVPGPVGPAGLNWQGIWSALTTYADNDAVSFGGASYFCYNPLGVGPSASDPTVDTANWALLASQGAIGPQGPQGIQGIPGLGSASFASTGSFSTSSLTNVLLTSILIPANTYSSIDAFDVVVHATKPNSFNGFTVLFVNTINSLVGANQLATTNGGATTTRFYSLKRTYFIDGANTYSFSVTGNSASDNIQTTNVASVTTIDWTQNQYIIVAGRVDNASISVTCKGVRIY